MHAWRSPHGRALPAIGKRTLVMGILNVTPDSFSDGGQLADPAAVLDRAAAMLEAGADVLDIGGESTRPGAAAVTEAEEATRVLPAIRAVRDRWPEAPISIDTFKPRIAEAAIGAGADIINDVWGLTYGLDAATRSHAINELAMSRAQPGTKPSLPTSPMAAVAARLGCPVILMHNRPDREYRDFWFDLLDDLRLSLGLARQAGIEDRQVWLDPGFGFAKSPGQNLEVIKHLDRIVKLGFPVLVGTSRKSTLGKVLGTTADDRLEGTAATCVWAIAQGCRMIRVHDVAPMVRYALMADAIKAGVEWSEG
ncbi:MAG TPA: dihydropteroate synthase [Opitutaceae bacterium]|nr:dihydropteroate synthase [Opitutaceae bacterium]